MSGRRLRLCTGCAALLVADAATAQSRALPVDAARLLLMDDAVTYDGRRATPVPGEARMRRPTTFDRARPEVDDEDADDGDDDAATSPDEPAPTGTGADRAAATGNRRPSAGGARTTPTAVDDDGEAEDDLKDRDVPYIQVDVAALAGYDDNPDQDEDGAGSVTYGAEGKLAAGVGGGGAKLALAAEGALVRTPAAPGLDRYTAEAELEGRAGIAGALAATATAGVSRFALTDPAERTEYGSAGFELADDDIGQAALRVGAEQRRYRAAAPGADETGSGAVRDTSDNEELRRLDYRRHGLEGEAEMLGDGLVRPFVSGSAYRIRFPNPSEDIGDRAATDIVAAAGAKFAFADDIALSVGARYNRRDFRDPAQDTIAHLTPTVAIDASPGDWLDLTAGYRREFAQPELTESIARDARIVEVAAVLRPLRRWSLFVNADYEFGREVRADAYDRELELTGRIEYLVAPRVRLLVEAYRDTYRFYQDDSLDFAYDRTTVRGGVKTRF